MGKEWDPDAFRIGTGKGAALSRQPNIMPPPRQLNVWRGAFLLFLAIVAFLFWLLHKLLAGMR